MVYCIAILVALGNVAMADVQVSSTENLIVPLPGQGWLHPSCAYGTNESEPGYGDLVMVIWAADGSDSSYGVPLLRSTDNGDTWGETVWLEKYIQEGNDRIKYGPSSLYADADNGLMVFFAQEAFYENNKLDSTFKKRRIVYRISKDNGLTWGERSNLIQSGADIEGTPFDEIHWMQGAVYGRNMSSTIGARVIKLRGEGPNNGKLLLPFQQQVVDEEGRIFSPAWGGHYSSGCLIGSWRDDLSDLTWECGEAMRVSHTVSSRGVFEPTVAELPDGRVIMVMRGSNSGLKGVTGCRFISVSEDQGLTWSDPVPLLYDDISVAKSGSSFSVLVPGPDGRTYFCGVLTDEEPNGNWPRYPIVLAPIDPVTLMVDKDKVITVVDKHGDDTNQVQYTCHWAYPDPQRNAITVMTPHLKGKVQGTAVDRHVVSFPTD